MKIKAKRNAVEANKVGVKLLLIIMCLLMAIGTLSACGKMKMEGSWYTNVDEDVVFNFLEDGTVVAYDTYLEEIAVGEWEIDGKECTLTGLGEENIAFQIESDDRLYNSEYSITLTRGENAKIPYTTEDELTQVYWYTSDDRYELEFYYSYDGIGEWDLFDYSISEYIYEGTYEIDYDSLTLKTEDGEKFDAKLSKNRQTISGVDDLVFESK